jgi:hypothetical protein
LPKTRSVEAGSAARDVQLYSSSDSSRRM